MIGIFKNQDPPIVHCLFVSLVINICYLNLKFTSNHNLQDIQAGTVDEGIERLDDLKCPLCHEKCKYPVQIACKV